MTVFTPGNECCTRVPRLVVSSILSIFFTCTFLVAQSGPAPDGSYDIVWESGSGLQSGTGFYLGSNAAQHIKAYFPETGLRLNPQDPSAGWAFELALTGYGHPGQIQSIGTAVQAVSGNQVTFNRTGALTEWYVNSPAGIQQWFGIASAPPDASGEARSVVFQLSLSSGLAAHVSSGMVLDAATADGQVAAQYRVWQAISATGKPLDATLALVTDANGVTTGLTIEVAATASDYPLTVALAAGAPKTLALSANSDAAFSALQPSAPIVPLVAPANDTCPGAQSIPGAGPFPYLTTTVDLADGTDAGDPAPSCAFSNVFSRGAWYSFTPTATQNYTISDCGTVAAGTTRTDTVLAVFTSSTGTCGGTYTQIACNDDDSGCGASGLESTLTATMTAGTTYFILAYSWDTPAPPAGQSSVQLRVTKQAAPLNDTCAGAQALTVPSIVTGTNASANNDYSLSGTACYSGLGNITSCTAAGRDTVYSFTAPAAGQYSFKATNFDISAGGNLVLYTSPTCPSPGAITCAAPVVANNRNSNTTQTTASEEIACQPMTAGQTLYLFVDECTATTINGLYTLDVSVCHPETEPNGTTATAQPYGFNATCPLTGSIGTAGDVDFFSLGTPPAGSRVFFFADGVPMNDNDLQMRVTTDTDTLEFDDDDNTSLAGALSPNISGRALTGVPAYVRINAFSATSLTEPYRLLGVIQPPGSGLYGTSAQDEANEGVNNTLGGAEVAGNMYFSATSLFAGDLDAFRFCAAAGDLIEMQIDADPRRLNANTQATHRLNPALFLFNDQGQQLLGVSDGQIASSNTSGAGSLTAVTPNSPGEISSWRARYTGTYFAGENSQTPSIGFPLEYLLSLAVNCQTGAEQSVDLHITKSATPEPVQNNGTLTYSITFSNNGPNIALDASIFDGIPVGTTFVSIDGSGTGGDWFCPQLPAPGENGAIACVNNCFTPGGSFTFVITVQVDPCLAAGTILENTVFADSLTNKADTSVLTATFDSTVTDRCDDGNPCTIDTCDPTAGCANTPDTGATCNDGSACTTSDTCDATGACVGGPAPNCDDGNPCTDDSCDTVLGCVHTDNTAPCSDSNACTVGDTCGGGTCHPGALPLVCDDGNGCTDDSCSPATGCVFTDNTAPCSDGNFCTTNDTCGGGTCNPGAPLVCNDGNGCTDDSCNPTSGCVFTDNTAPCTDGSACTVGDTCGGGTCHPGAPLVCNDGNGCTDDSCSPATGCVYTNNTAPCDDGNACTTGDTCGGGTCHSGGPTNCDDGNCCTIDSCNPSSGCFYTANTTPPVFVQQPSLGSCPTLWPPNHKYADFTVSQMGATASSACGIASIQVASCSSSQAENATDTGDGNTTRDCVFAGGTVSVRAERDGACSPTGRVYETTLVAVDVCGNTATSNPVDIAVWHDRGHAPAGGTVYAGTSDADHSTATNGTYGAGCGAGSACANGTTHDDSDADPEMEISQNASVSVTTLQLARASGGNVKLSWESPVPNGQVTRYHIYRLDPVTFDWTMIAEVSKLTTSFQDPVLSDGHNYQYKVAAVIK
jgi:uncharacterized repeat protein (TIGR01451 family)